MISTIISGLYVGIHTLKINSHVVEFSEQYEHTQIWFHTTFHRVIPTKSRNHYDRSVKMTNKKLNLVLRKV